MAGTTTALSTVTSTTHSHVRNNHLLHHHQNPASILTYPHAQYSQLSNPSINFPMPTFTPHGAQQFKPSSDPPIQFRCDACLQNHLTCSAQKPCHHCGAQNLVCTIDGGKPVRKTALSLPKPQHTTSKKLSPASPTAPVIPSISSFPHPATPSLILRPPHPLSSPPSSTTPPTIPRPKWTPLKAPDPYHKNSRVLSTAHALLSQLRAHHSLNPSSTLGIPEMSRLLSGPAYLLRPSATAAISNRVRRASNEAIVKNTFAAAAGKLPGKLKPDRKRKRDEDAEADLAEQSGGGSGKQTQQGGGGGGGTETAEGAKGLVAAEKLAAWIDESEAIHEAVWVLRELKGLEKKLRGGKNQKKKKVKMQSGEVEGGGGGGGGAGGREGDEINDEEQGGGRGTAGIGVTLLVEDWMLFNE